MQQNNFMTMSNVLLIIGLGNPERKYKKTRHNIGFRIINKFQKENSFLKFKLAKKFQAEISEGTISDKKIILAKPQTYMNLSGTAVKALLEFYKIPTKNLIIIHDELDLPIGDVRLSQDKGSAGHNGIKSIIQEIGTKNFTRIRIGIKPNTEIPEYKSFVLKKFSKDEEQTLKQVIKNSFQKIQSAIDTL